MNFIVNYAQTPRTIKEFVRNLTASLECSAIQVLFLGNGFWSLEVILNEPVRQQWDFLPESGLAYAWSIFAENQWNVYSQQYEAICTLGINFEIAN